MVFFGVSCRNIYQKTSLLGAIALLLAATYGAVSPYVRPQPASTQSSHQKQTGYKFARPQQELFGFSCEVQRAGENLFSLRAKSFTVQKRKVGFFRFGLLKEAVINQASFTLFAESSTKNTASGKQAADNAIANGIGSVFPEQELASLVCKPISLSIEERGLGGRQAYISADFAELRADRNSARFQGNVSVSSGKRSLQTEELKFFLNDYRIEVEQGYAGATERGRIEGKGLQSNCFLDSLAEK